MVLYHHNRKISKSGVGTKKLAITVETVDCAGFGAMWSSISVLKTFEAGWNAFCVTIYTQAYRGQAVQLVVCDWILAPQLAVFFWKN